MVTSRWASSHLVKPLIKARKRLRVLTAEEYSLLHAIDFRHRLETAILPALWAGKTVIADRYLFTALARDAARGLELDWLLHMYAPLVWPDLVVYFALDPLDSSRRVAATRAPRFYESGQDVTGLADPLTSYRQFIDRVITEYENLSVIFHFVKVDADQVVYRQHQQVRQIVQGAARRPWSEFSAEAIQRMAHETPPPGRLIAVEGSRGADVAAEAERDLPSGCALAAIDVRYQPLGRIWAVRRSPARRVQTRSIVSPRMLALLYAADLVFRLRWEIQPGPGRGPRGDCRALRRRRRWASASGLALPEAWLREVLRFAPAADADTAGAGSANPGAVGSRGIARGFGEFSRGGARPAPLRVASGGPRGARAMKWLAETPRAESDAGARRSWRAWPATSTPPARPNPSARAASQRT